MNLPVRLHVSIEDGLQASRPATSQVRALCEQAGLDADQSMGWELAIAEGLNNAVLYGSETTPPTLDFILAKDWMEARIIDQGPGFELPELSDLPDEESVSGRGLWLMRELTDGLDYFRGSEGNCLILRGKPHFKSPGTSPPPEDCIASLTRKLEEAEATLLEMTEELGSCYESLAAIFEFSSSLSSNQSTPTFVNKVFNHLRNITGANWYVLRLAKKDSRSLRFVSSHGTTSLPPMEILLDPNQPSDIEASVVQARQDKWIDTARLKVPADPLVNCIPPCTGLVHPFFLDEKLVGVLSIGKWPDTDPFSAAQVNVIHTFCDSLSIQILNTQLYEEQIRTKVLSKELDIAKSIQQSLLPSQIPSLPKLSVAGHSRSAREVGGDFYDVIPMKEYGVLMVMADVMGKGIPAAMFATILRSLIRAAPEFARHPELLMYRLNRFIQPDLSRVDMFITCMILFADLEEQVLKVANAGHCPLLVCDHTDKNIQMACHWGSWMMWTTNFQSYC